MRSTPKTSIASGSMQFSKRSGTDRKGPLNRNNLSQLTGVEDETKKTKQRRGATVRAS